ncbi:unnamed protein product [Didymodactylos carnosus]|uniref:Uncharacterized protein n=1 Tax=Didymodactylos carnosus TaxID=1234261 RepID=A0A815GP01_9BILA|nr:unnamed protein product [Didymodactylos carnosus]CAF4205252.1 unnamed protein product [Didymodactylos carnosus]
MLTQEQIDRLYGFLVLQQLLTLDECQKLKIAVGQLIDNWEPDPVYSWIFLNDKDKQQARAQLMVPIKDELSSGIEEEAIDPQTGIM